MPDLRVYGKTSGQHATFYFGFLDPDSSDGDLLQSSPTLAAGDARIMIDGGSWAATSATPAWESEGIGSITLTATEMQGEILVLKIRDQTTPREWVTVSFVVHTGGNASALHDGTTS